MFKKILVPVDGSSTSWRALETAKDLAVKFDGELIVAHIVQTYSSADLYINSLDQTAVAAENDQLTRIGSSVLDTARTKMEGFTGKVDYLMDVGHASDRIIELSKDKHADAIVIGSRGLSGIAEFFLGSVSSRVAQYAAVPVLIVK